MLDSHGIFILGDNMDMSNYIQPNCINGVSKEDAEKVKEIPQIQEDIETIQEDIETITETTIPVIEDDIATINETSIPAIQDDISSLDERVTYIENNPKITNWELYESTDLSEIFDLETFKPKKDILIKMMFNITISQITSSCYCEFELNKGFSIVGDHIILRNPFNDIFINVNSFSSSGRIIVFKIIDSIISSNTIDFKINYYTHLLSGTSTYTFGNNQTVTVTIDITGDGTLTNNYIRIFTKE